MVRAPLRVGHHLPSKQPVCAAALSAASANTLPFVLQSSREFRLALGDSGNRTVSWGDGSVE